jgi:hypothetical protein
VNLCKGKLSWQLNGWTGVLQTEHRLARLAIEMHMLMVVGLVDTGSATGKTNNAIVGNHSMYEALFLQTVEYTIGGYPVARYQFTVLYLICGECTVRISYQIENNLFGLRISCFFHPGQPVQLQLAPCRWTGLILVMVFFDVD